MRKYQKGDPINRGDEYRDQGGDTLIVRDKINGQIYWLFKKSGITGDIFEEGLSSHLLEYGYCLINDKEDSFDKLYLTLKS